MSASVSRLLPLLGGRRGTLGGSAGMHRRGGGESAVADSGETLRVRIARRTPLAAGVRRVLEALSLAISVNDRRNNLRFGRCWRQQMEEEISGRQFFHNGHRRWCTAQVLQHHRASGRWPNCLRWFPVTAVSSISTR